MPSVRVIAYEQKFEHIRQHARHHGEVREHARIARRRAHHPAGAGEENHRNTAASNAAQVRLSRREDDEKFSTAPSKGHTFAISLRNY